VTVNGSDMSGRCDKRRNDGGVWSRTEDTFYNHVDGYSGTNYDVTLGGTGRQNIVRKPVWGKGDSS